MSIKTQLCPEPVLKRVIVVIIIKFTHEGRRSKETNRL